MGKQTKDARRQERKERSELERLERERRKDAVRMRNRIAIVVGIVVVAAIVYLGVNRRASGDGRVWSAEHGHYHDRSGREIR